MPRFTKGECQAVMGAVEAFIDTKDAETRAALKSALRKIQQTADHHAKREAAKGRKA